MPRNYHYTYDVQGTGDVPMDMLRYDGAYPATSEDGFKIYADRHMDNERLRVFLRTPRIVRLSSHREPTPARWASFGWKVLNVRKH